MFSEPKVDAHCHVLDPVRFPYASDVTYRPAGQEQGGIDEYLQVMQAYGIRHALLVAPNSGYSLDNRYLLHALAQGGGRFRGVAMVRPDTPRQALERLREAGVAGVAFNAAMLGVDYYAGCAPLLRELADLDLFVNLQVTGDQLLALGPLLQRSGVRVVVDHCGRPRPGEGVGQPGFPALLALGRSGRAAVKLSGLVKFSQAAPPHEDALAYVNALLEAFTPAACLWASDWPFLRAGHRIDMGPLLLQAQRWLPAAADRRQVLWEAPRRWLGFDQAH